MIKYENQTYLTTEEASKYLGKTVTAFRQFLNRSGFPRRKLGGRLYFLTDDLNGYYAKKRGYLHFEKTNLLYDQVYDMEQLQKIFLTTKQNIYSFIHRNGITRYKDNKNTTLYDKLQVDLALSKLKNVATKKDTDVSEL